MNIIILMMLIATNCPYDNEHNFLLRQYNDMDENAFES